MKCPPFYFWTWISAVPLVVTSHFTVDVNSCPTRCDYIQFYYISAKSSTCFGWYLHPSSGVHVNCNYSIWHWSNRICYLPLSWGVGTSYYCFQASTELRNTCPANFWNTCSAIFDFTRDRGTSSVSQWVLSVTFSSLKVPMPSLAMSSCRDCPNH